MTQSKYAFQAGLFILASIALGMLVIAKVAESRSMPSDAKSYIAIFANGEEVSGLVPGSEVRLMGVKVGRVESIEIVTPETDKEDARIHVNFMIAQGVELRKEKPEVELQTAVTGGAWLNILSVGTGEPLPEGGAVVASTISLISIMTNIEDEMQKTLATVRVELDRVGDELVDTSDDIESFAENADALITDIDDKINTLLEESTGVMADIRGVFGDSGSDIRTTLSKLGSLTTKLDTKVPRTLDEINTFVNKTEKSIDGVDKLVSELTGTATEARTLLADNRTDIDRTIESARRSVDELEGLVDDLRANPSRLIWPPDDKDLNNNALYAMARSYAKAAEDLESAAGALHKASQDESTEPEKIKALRAGLLQQFEHFDKLQKEVWERFEE